MENKWVIFVSVVFFSMAALSSAYAHEKRVVADNYEFIVGFVNEPAFSGQMNGFDVRISAKSKPVEGLEKTLSIKVTTPDGKQSIDIPLRPSYKEPGKYTGYFLPTRPGKYVFIVQGEIKGLTIDERFESGEKFHNVENAEPLRFPKY